MKIYDEILSPNLNEQNFFFFFAYLLRIFETNKVSRV